MLRATTRVLHFVVCRFDSKDNLGKRYTQCVGRAMSAFSDSVSDRMLLCASLGALNLARI